MLAATFALSVLIGVSLALLGGGGSILTVPILTYVAKMEPKNAIAAALFIVAVTSAAGVAIHARAGRVIWRVGLLFGVTSMASAFIGGRFAAIIPDSVLMIAFGVMMAATAVAMMIRPRARPAGPAGELDVGNAALQGVVIGALTGLIGVGGGFMIVPALVLFGRIAMERAVGTSLLVICMNSSAGFAGHLGHATIDWSITLPVAAIAVAGSLLGGTLAGRISPMVLRKAFAFLLAIVALVVLVQETRF